MPWLAFCHFDKEQIRGLLHVRITLGCIMSTKTLRGADGIRALACLMVIAHHAMERLSPDALSPGWQAIRTFVLQWNVGVSGFFVLSGFLLSMPYWEAFGKDEPLPGLKEFSLRRLARIAPAYYAALIICYLIQGPAPDALLRLLTGLSFTAGFHWRTWFPSEINGPLWSISLEVFCYALLPLGMWTMFRIAAAKQLLNGLKVWLGILLLILVLNQLVIGLFQTGDTGRGWEYGLQGGAKYWLPHYNPIAFFAHYILGVLAAGCLIWLRHQSAFEAWQQSWRFDLGAAAALAFLFCGLWLARDTGEFSWSLQGQPYFYPFIPLCFASSLCLLAASRESGDWADNIVTRSIATLSFGLYLWHFTVMELMQRTFAADFHYIGVFDLERFAGLNLIMLGVSLALAMLSRHFIEQPILGLVRRRFPHPEPAVKLPAWEQQ